MLEAQLVYVSDTQRMLIVIHNDGFEFMLAGNSIEFACNVSGLASPIQFTMALEVAPADMPRLRKLATSVQVFPGSLNRGTRLEMEVWNKEVLDGSEEEVKDGAC